MTIDAMALIGATFLMVMVGLSFLAPALGDAMVSPMNNIEIATFPDFDAKFVKAK